MEFDITNGVTFNEYNSYDDLGLILKSKVIGMATPKTEYITIQGRNGDIDLTNATSDIIYYNNRTLEFEFVCIDPLDWANVVSDVTRKLHGKKMQISIDEDTNYYYQGRVNVDTVNTLNKELVFKVTCNCEPYKYNKDNGGGNWLWDTFSFVYGVIRDYSSIDIDGEEIITVEVEQMPYVPTITSDTAGITVKFENETYTLKVGDNKFYDMVLTPYSKKLIFNGKGTISIIYQGGVM